MVENENPNRNDMSCKGGIWIDLSLMESDTWGLMATVIVHCCSRTSGFLNNGSLDSSIQGRTDQQKMYQVSLKK